jgi:hypothetical protein
MHQDSNREMLIKRMSPSWLMHIAQVLIVKEEDSIPAAFVYIKTNKNGLAVKFSVTLFMAFRFKL